MIVNAEPRGPELRIAIEGRFDFSAHEAFRVAYEARGQRFDRYEVDLRKASHLDSAALGMLLLLRDHAGGESAQVRFVNCNPDVRRILGIANFDQLFSIA